MHEPRRVVLIGLDCATPELLFDRFADDMPTLTRLRADAVWGPMTSVVPPITMPAWACMMSGQTPGDLGVYGFRDRAGYDYDPLAFASSRSITVPRVWDALSATGRSSVVLGVPGTYPTTPINGCMVGCFLSPSTESDFTYPSALREDIQRLTGGYILDVEDFRSNDHERVLQRVFDMTEQRFKVAGHLMANHEWDLFSFVDMGPDRLHHGFWKYCDPAHPRYEPGNPFEQAFRDYYRALDTHLARFLAMVPDDAAVLLVSDHGGQPMEGGFCINEWLIEQGLLTLRRPPDGPTPISKADIVWSKTVAWAEGGYYGRLFLNVRGREPNGLVPMAEYDAMLDAISTALGKQAGPDGEPMNNRAMRPSEVYPVVNGIAPDLIVYLGDLHWRALATVGLGQGLFTADNDTGPDHANHAEQGVLVLANSGLDAGPRTDLSLYDVAPTLHSLLGLPANPAHRGQLIT
ncbi:MAG TPA: alkaline phosphatase family protein [Actinophytocola sp.]|uniref:alkaline phosphatase family protein n=1 Tax=Actinophytocola sp. TaxID=1872138 RepID=UPI002DBCF4C6|nr:alkaline phosphatase family protein [Actinophytocola sp.]HEU5469379.1 alkaline phosphatase family protein [Actinophytocola sp.]